MTITTNAFNDGFTHLLPFIHESFTAALGLRPVTPWTPRHWRTTNHFHIDTSRFHSPVHVPVYLHMTTAHRKGRLNPQSAVRQQHYPGLIVAALKVLNMASEWQTWTHLHYSCTFFVLNFFHPFPIHISPYVTTVSQLFLSRLGSGR